MSAQHDRSVGLPIDAEQALSAHERLPRTALEQIRHFTTTLTPKARERYFVELALQLGDDLVSVETALNENRDAIQTFDASAQASLREVRATIEKFDKSSRKLTRWLIGLTVVLIILTIVIAAFTILLWKRG